MTKLLRLTTRKAQETRSRIRGDVVVFYVCTPYKQLIGEAVVIEVDTGNPGGKCRPGLALEGSCRRRRWKLWVIKML